MRKAFLVVSCNALLLSCGTGSCAAQMLVWHESALVKVRPSDAPKPATSTVTIDAARNEYEPFQIVIRGQNRRLRGVLVELSDFLGNGGERISCRANCTAYRQVYIQIRNPSGPYGSAGEWPDALIPDVDRYAGEERNAFPFDLVENRNQAIWIDVYVPPATKPGLYRANVSVRAHGEQTFRLPVYLTVRRFTLPATSSVRNAFLLWPGALTAAHGPAFVGEALEKLVQTYSKALLVHRLSNGLLLGDGMGWQPKALNQPTSESLAQLQRDWGSFFNGSILPGGGQITAVLPDYNMCLQGTFCHADVVSFLSAAEWIDRIAFYLPDEPNLSDPSVVQTIQSIADTIHQRDSRLRTFLTHRYSDLLQPQIDIWVVPLPALQQSLDEGSYWTTYANEINRGKELWTYQACFTHNSACGSATWFPGFPGWPDYMIDMQGMKNRIQDWVNWKFQVRGELYWGVNWGYYEANPFENQFLAGGNGEGNFFYPGVPSHIGGTTHIPIESIRLKLKREGLEDYEYLALLARFGGVSLAEQKVGELVQSAIQWKEEPEALERIRVELADQIELLLSAR